MTDQERAAAFVRDWTGESDLSPEPLAETVDTLVIEFEAVRLDERRAIVAFLQRRVQEAIKAPLSPREANTTSVYVASLTGEAQRIERGEHAS